MGVEDKIQQVLFAAVSLMDELFLRLKRYVLLACRVVIFCSFVMILLREQEKIDTKLINPYTARATVTVPRSPGRRRSPCSTR